MFIYLSVKHDDDLSTERTCAGSELQVDGAETESAREVKLLIMTEGLARRFVLEEHQALDGRRLVQTGKEDGR